MVYCRVDLDEMLMAGIGDPVTAGLKEGNRRVRLARAEGYEGQRCRQGYLGGCEFVDKQENRQTSNDLGTQELQVSMRETESLGKRRVVLEL